MAAAHYVFRREQDLNLIISMDTEPVTTVDNLAVAQFIYLMFNNENIRNVLNTITPKGVLILGRFSDPERKARRFKGEFACF